jgi:hypothetical protein
MALDLGSHAAHAPCGECHDTALFTAPPPPDLLCGICAGVARAPVETPCGHVFGHCCLLRWAEKCGGAAPRQLTCPIDQAPLDLAACRVSVRDQRRLGDLRVRCAVCAKEEELRAHAESHRAEPCAFCRRAVPLAHHRQHAAGQECAARPVPCRLCGERVPAGAMADHTAAPAFAGVHIAVLEQRVAALEMQAAVPLPAKPGPDDFERLWGAVRMGVPAKQLCERIKFNVSYASLTHTRDTELNVCCREEGIRIAAHHVPLLCAEINAWKLSFGKSRARNVGCIARALNAEPDAPYADYTPVIAALPKEARDVAVWRRELNQAIFAQLEPHFAAADAVGK